MCKGSKSLKCHLFQRMHWTKVIFILKLSVFGKRTRLTLHAKKTQKQMEMYSMKRVNIKKICHMYYLILAKCNKNSKLKFRKIMPKNIAT